MRLDRRRKGRKEDREGTLVKPGPARMTHLTLLKSMWRSTACRICSCHLSTAFIAPVRNRMNDPHNSYSSPSPDHCLQPQP